jgi:hypothetical protein
MAIGEYASITPLANPEAQARAVGIIEKEFQTRFIGDSEAAGHAYLATLGLRASDADTRVAIEKRDRAEYEAIKVVNPFDAASFATRHPHVHKHAPDTVNTALRMAQQRAIGSRLAADAAKAVK